MLNPLMLILDVLARIQAVQYQLKEYFKNAVLVVEL